MQGQFMRILSFALPLSALTAIALPAAAIAQNAPVETRVDRLEREMRAVQRKVFPGGTPIEPEITAAPPPQVVPGAPASTPVADLIARVDALEQQQASLTGQIEQNSYRLKQLEDAFAKYKADMDARTAAPPPAVTPTNPGAGASAAPSTRPAAPANGERKIAVAAIERPSTGDDASDSYTYGYRLWDAKFYPEAETQLTQTLEKFGSSPIASRTHNLLGRAYLDDGKPALAATTFYDNYQKRPNGDRAADSLAWLGEALIQLKKPVDACKVYSQLDQDYGASLGTGLKDMMAKGRARAKCAA
jgi:TolA-binding protein